MHTIRDATAADIDIIADGNCKLAWESEAKTLDPAVTRAGVSAAISDPGGRGPYYLACDGGDVIGQCQITREWSDWRNRWIWWLQGVYVRADRRGTGVFRALYEHVQAQARISGDVFAIRLYVERDNQLARAVYRKLGFAVEHYDMMCWHLPNEGSPAEF